MSADVFFAFLCREPQGRRALSLPSGQLPLISGPAPEAPEGGPLHHFETELSHQGVHGHVLRKVFESEMHHVYELALHGAPKEGDAQWVESFSLVPDELRGAVDGWLAEADTVQPRPHRPPWAQPAWRPEAEDWIDEQLATLGDRRAGPVLSITASTRSAVLRVPAQRRGELYFKADHALAPAEVVVTRWLAERWPEHVPSIVAHDDARGWMLTEDLGGTRLSELPTEAWEDALRLHASMQVECASLLPELSSLGFRDLRGERLGEALREAIGTLGSDLVEATDGFTQDEQRELLALQPSIDAACDELWDSSVPPSLVHQDLMVCNIAVPDGRPVFYDWSDVVLGHPFFACDRLLDDCWSDPERKERVIDAYLEPWSAFESPERLRRVFDACLRLRVLYEDLRWTHELRETEAGSPAANRLRKDVVHGFRSVLAHWRP